MIIKFIKEHEVGISKGTVTNVNETIALKFIANGYAEESDLKTLEDFQRAIHKDKLKIAKASMKSAEKKNKERNSEKVVIKETPEEKPEDLEK